MVILVLAFHVAADVLFWEGPHLRQGCFLRGVCSGAVCRMRFGTYWCIRKPPSDINLVVGGVVGGSSSRVEVAHFALDQR